MQIIKKNESMLDKNFTKIPNKLFKHKLTPMQLTIIVYLLTHQHKYNLTKQQAHREIGIARDTLNINLKEIEKHGLIRIKGNQLVIDHKIIMSDNPTVVTANHPTQMSDDPTSTSSNPTNNVQSADTYKTNNTIENTNNKKEEIYIPRRIEDFPKEYQRHYYIHLVQLAESDEYKEFYFNNREEASCKIEYNTFKQMLNDQFRFNPDSKYLKTEFTALNNTISQTTLRQTLSNLTAMYRKFVLGESINLIS